VPAADHRARFRELHAREQLFLMPNPWDVGSARMLASLGFEALATTSAGFAWSIGKADQQVTRDELVAHVAAIAAATPLPLNVDSERCYPELPGGVAETVRQLGEAGAAGCSIEDYNPETDGMDEVGLAAQRVAEAAEAAHALDSPMVLTGRCENHIRGVDDLDDTIVYAPGLSTEEQIRAVIDAVGVPVNVLALASGPSVAELASLGVRRVSTGGALARAAYGALLTAATELRDEGTSNYTRTAAPSRDLEGILKNA
jgi:2-methylisocitrate lyase-like PEP mutase family enzyme